MNTTTTTSDVVSSSSPFFSRICDKYFYSSEWLTCTICIYITFQTVFWLYNLFLLFIEYNDIPSIDKYRIQKQKPKLRFQPDIIRQMRNGTIKHQFSLILFLPLIYYLLNYFGHVSVRSPIPSLFTITWQIIVLVLSEDFVFFWTHYLFHTPHPWESLLQNQLAVWIALIFLNEKHIFTICLWIFIRVYQTINAHSGYDLPYISAQYYFPWLMSGTLQHDYHHQHAKMNYGSFLTLWDRFMNTHRLQKND